MPSRSEDPSRESNATRQAPRSGGGDRQSPRGSFLTELRRAIRDSFSGEHHDYTTGNLNRAIALLAIPMVLEMAMESVFALVDIYFVNQLDERVEASATVGLTESMLTILYAIAIGLAMATTATVARRVGERDLDGAVTAATQGILISVGIAAAFGVFGAVFAADLLRAMGAEESVVDVGSGYTTIMLGTNVVIMLLFVNNAVFRGAGDAAVAMRSLWLANAINIVLDPCLLFGLGPFPELGVTGAAVATTIGRGTGVAYQFWCLRRGASRLVLRGPAFRLDGSVALRLLRVSAGSIVQFLIATASWIVLVRIVSPFGSVALAGYTIAIRIVMFAFLPAWGLANSAATLVGQSLGAEKPDRAERAVWLTGRYNTAFLFLVTVVFVAVPETIVGFITTDVEVLPVGTECLRVISYGYVFYAWGMVMVQAFNGAGDTWTPTWINLGCFWACQIPLAWTLANPVGLGPPGVFWSVAISETLLAVVAIAIFRRGRWKTRVV